MSDWEFICATKVDADVLIGMGRSAQEWAPGDSERYRGQKVALVGGGGLEGRSKILWAACELDGVAGKVLVYDLPPGSESLSDCDVQSLVAF